MSKAIVDPDDLEKFAQGLRDATSDLSHRLTTLKWKFDQLSETWRDQEQLKFAQEFEQTVRALESFTQVAEEYIPFLLRKAAVVREYLDQH